MRGEIKNIQALRALAAVAVVIYHIRTIGVGLFGVDIFFVISGFIICYITQRRAENFLLHRIFRIVPLYWAATLAIFVVGIIAPRLLQTDDASLVHLAKSLFFIPYQRPNGLVQPVLFLGWTLNYEMFFYLVFWACLLAFRNAAPIACAVALVLVVTITKIIHPVLPWSFWGDWRLLEFVGGIAAFLLLKSHGDTIRAIPKWALWAICGVSIAAMVWQTRYFSHDFEVAICGPLAVALFIAAAGLEGRVRMPAFVLAIGDASYSLYLLHPWALRAIEKFIHPAIGLSWEALVASLLIVCGSVTIALVSYRYFEAPSNRALRRFAKA